MSFVDLEARVRSDHPLRPIRALVSETLAALDGDIAARFLSAVLAHARVKCLLSSEHFSVDGTLIEAWASMKSFKPKDGSGPTDASPSSGGRNAEGHFRGEKRSNETQASTTGPDAKFYRKGPSMEAKLAFLGHALMENCSGLLVDACLTRISDHAEPIVALAMIETHADRPRPITLGADRGYDAADFVNELRSMNVRAHVAQNLTRRHGGSAIDVPTTRHPGYAASQRIDEGFGWVKMVAGLDSPRLRDVDRVGWAFTFAAAAYNLVRLPKILAGTT